MNVFLSWRVHLQRGLLAWLCLLTISSGALATLAVVTPLVLMTPRVCWAEDEEEPEPLLEPFDPPTLEEIEAKVKWEDLLVTEGGEILAEELAALPAPELTQEEAIALENDSQEKNVLIRDALGRQPQEDEWDHDAELVHHVSGDIKSTNPIMMSATVEFDLHGLMGSGFFSFDARMKPFASSNYVVSWQTSEDRMYDKVVLRDDITWSDGKPFTAHDVEFSFLTIMNPKVPVPAVRSGTDHLKYVKAYDDHTLIYFHKEAKPTNVWDVNFPVIPKHIFAESVEDDPTLQTSEYHVGIEQEPVTIGPYELVKRVRGQEIVLQRREGFYMHDGEQVRSKPFFKRIIFKVITDANTSLLALKSGLVDETILTAEQWKSQTGDDEFYRRNTKANGLEWVYFYFGWNCKNPLFSDKRVRQAMSYAYDYDEMVNTLFYGLYEQANSMFHPTAWMAPQNPPLPVYRQDLDKAQALLREAGWDDHDNDGVIDKEIDGRRVPFEFSIITSQSKNSVKACVLLKESLDRIGIVCHVRPLEFTVLIQKSRDHKYQAMMGGWGTGTDPYTNENLFATGENRNYGEYSNPEVDALFKQGMSEFDREKRTAIYQEIARKIYEDQPYTWLFYRSSFYGFNKSLRGYRFSPRGPYNYSPGFRGLWKPPQDAVVK